MTGIMGVPASALFTAHRHPGASGQGPSERIWEALGTQLHPDGSNPWVVFGDDFLGHVVCEEEKTDEFVPPYYSATTSDNAATVIARVPDVEGGVIRLAAGGADNQNCALGTGRIAGMCKVGVGTPGTLTAKGGGLLFEARVRTTAIADDEAAMFVGLTEVNKLAAEGVIPDGGAALATVSALGFYQLHAAGATLNFGYREQAETAVAVGSHTLVADTWVKIGFKYVPGAPPSKRLTWFVNGVEQSSAVTASAIGGAGFPGGKSLAPIALCKRTADETKNLDMDWWYVGYQRA